MSTRVTIKHGTAGKYDYHVYHDVFDEETVFLEVYARHVKLEYDERSGMVTIGLHRDAARALGVITQQEYEDVDMKLMPVGDSARYTCTNAHPHCGEQYPGAWCKSCGVRA